MNATPDIETLRAQYWARVEALETVRARELAAMTDEQALRIILSLEAAEPIWRQEPNWSGLIEQQAFFHRLPGQSVSAIKEKLAALRSQCAREFASQFVVHASDCGQPTP